MKKRFSEEQIIGVSEGSRGRGTGQGTVQETRI